MSEKFEEWYYGYDPLISEEAWYYGYAPLISEDMVSFVDTQNAYNQGRVDERNRIVERIKDNLTPSVAETVIAIIYAA